MKTKHYYFKYCLHSITSLFLAFILLWIMQYLLIQAGAILSGFQGQITFNGLVLSVISRSWLLRQVVSLYFFPYIAIVFIYLIFSTKRYFGKSIWLHLFYGWVSALLLVHVFFLPVWNFINKEGLYYVLQWLNISDTVQLYLGSLGCLILLYNQFKLSQIFSSSLHLSTPIDTKVDFIKIVFSIWFIPIIFTLVLGYFYNINIMSVEIVIVILIVFIMLLFNLPLIIKYKVII